MLNSALSSALQVHHCLSTKSCLGVMSRQQLWLRYRHRGKLRQQYLRNARMVPLTRLAQQRLIGDFLGEDMLKRVVGLRHEARFVEKLGRLEGREILLEAVLRPLRDGLQEGQGDIFADYGCRLQEALGGDW